MDKIQWTLIGIGLILLMSSLSYAGITYRDGQIDALTGNIYYELQEQDDGTTQWIYVPGGIDE